MREVEEGERGKLPRVSGRKLVGGEEAKGEMVPTDMCGWAPGDNVTSAF